jgi:hypothetical protein
MKHIIKNLNRRTPVCVIEKDGHMTTIEPGETRILDVREIKTPSYCRFSIEPQPECARAGFETAIEEAEHL